MFQTIQGSAHDIAQVADKSVQLICTSPPYFNLRAYDGEQAIEWPTVEYAPMPGFYLFDEARATAAWARVESRLPDTIEDWELDDIKNAVYAEFVIGYQKPATIQVPPMRCALGLESDPFAYIGHLILCLREWKRCLRDDGLAFVNLGDSYGAGTRTSNMAQSAHNGNTRNLLTDSRAKGFSKNLMQIPQRFALAAQADGWFLRSAIVWAKGLSFLPDYAGSCMPESVTDRPTQSYEMVYMLAKSERYFCDMEAVKEENSPNSQTGGQYRNEWKFKQIKEIGATSANQVGVAIPRNGRNLRSVWAISPTGFVSAHFACWPERLVEPMIKMGTSARGCCPACGAPWRRVVERTANYGRRQHRDQPEWKGPQVDSSEWRPPTIVEHGWEPTCTCDAGEPQPCTVLDPFSGSGTTGKVAVRLGRRYIGVDLSEKYLTEITEARMGAGVQMELTW